MSGPRLPWVRRMLRHFVGRGDAGLLPTSEDLDALVARPARDSMLFDYYTRDDLLDALVRYGAMPALESLGFSNVDVTIDTDDPPRQIVRVHAERDGDRALVGEVILRADRFVTREPWAVVLHGREMRMLFVQWLRLQDPTRRFDDDRPALPGQDHPGLGVGRQVMAMFLGMTARLGFSGIMVCPEFAHNALLYAREFRFFDPRAQGRFEAICRARGELSLARFAWGVDRGCLVETSTGRTARWFHEEMVRARDEVLLGYLLSEPYERIVRETREALRFEFDGERLRALGSPDGQGAG